MLDTLHYEDFAPHAHTKFRVQISEQAAMEFELISVEDKSPSPRQEQFVLTFRDYFGAPTATISAFDSTSANGGNVSLTTAGPNAGAFTYNPPPGFEGPDTFTYTLMNSAGSDTGTVTITVSGMIWFINNNAAACTTLAAGCGRLTNPFSSLAAFQALNNGSGNNPAAGDNIFIYREVATDYTGGVTLLNNQKLIGQGATDSLSSITGITPPAGSDPLPSTGGTNPVIANSGGAGITVGSTNLIRGLTVGDTTGAGITGSSFGTLTVADASITGLGQALNLSSGPHGLAF